MLALLFHFFADDSQLWKTVNPRSVTDQLHSIRNIETSIKSVAEWMFHNKLQLNKDKTEFMIIASKRNHKRICVDHLDLEGDTPLSYGSGYLGVKAKIFFAYRQTISKIVSAGLR